MDDTIGETEEKGESETRDILDSGEMTQQKEEEEKRCPKLINRGGNNEDSDTESDNEEEMEMEEDEKDDSDETAPIEEKGRA
eukprot:6765302-Ditylum_brightwellii.AAC.1